MPQVEDYDSDDLVIDREKLELMEKLEKTEQELDNAQAQSRTQQRAIATKNEVSDRKRQRD